MLLATGSMSATAAGEREGRGCWPWQPRNHFCFNVTDTVPQTQGPPRPRPPRPAPAPPLGTAAAPPCPARPASSRPVCPGPRLQRLVTSARPGRTAWTPGAASCPHSCHPQSRGSGLHVRAGAAASSGRAASLRAGVGWRAAPPSPAAGPRLGREKPQVSNLKTRTMRAGARGEGRRCARACGGARAQDTVRPASAPRGSSASTI